MNKISIIPIKSNKIVTEEDDINNVIYSSLTQNKERLYDRDVLVVSSKVVALSQGILYSLDEVVSDDEAELIAAKYKMDSRFVQLIKENSYV